jgi:hypothetical protein
VECDQCADVDVAHAIAVGEANASSASKCFTRFSLPPVIVFRRYHQRDPPRLGAVLQDLHPIVGHIEHDVRRMQKISWRNTP